MPIRPITDPSRIVTDPVVLKQILRAGMDPNFVEFFGDYRNPDFSNKVTPFNKFYRNLLSKKDEQIMVASGLPMRRLTDGEKLDINWVQQGSLFKNSKNLYNLEVDGTQFHAAILNDQPNGNKVGDSLTAQPRLFLNGVEKFPVSSVPTLLPFDPTNPDLAWNVLEWDYGVCKRYLRMVQGRFRGFWVFNEDPKKDVQIIYNQTGNLRLRLGCKCNIE